jgi:prepilin-type processing-associated H-X9-DG protein
MKKLKLKEDEDGNKVHNGGANVGLLDGHIERVPFKKLWNVDATGSVTHPFWWLDD